MPKFSDKSNKILSTCDVRLQKLFNEVIKYFDCTIVCGFRNQADQDKAFAEGNSKLKWPDGKHNKTPSLAVDVVPCFNGTLLWDAKECCYMGGIVLGIAYSLGLKIRWGGDFNRNNNVLDEKFSDLVHFEIDE